MPRHRNGRRCFKTSRKNADSRQTLPSYLSTCVSFLKKCLPTSRIVVGWILSLPSSNPARYDSCKVNLQDWLFYRSDAEAFMPRYWRCVRQLLFILVRGIPPSKTNLAIGEGDETMVGMATRWV